MSNNNEVIYCTLLECKAYRSSDKACAYYGDLRHDLPLSQCTQYLAQCTQGYIQFNRTRFLMHRWEIIFRWSLLLFMDVLFKKDVPQLVLQSGYQALETEYCLICLPLGISP